MDDVVLADVDRGVPIVGQLDAPANHLLPEAAAQRVDRALQFAQAKPFLLDAGDVKLHRLALARQRRAAHAQAAVREAVHVMLLEQAQGGGDDFAR